MRKPLLQWRNNTSICRAGPPLSCLPGRAAFAGGQGGPWRGQRRRGRYRDGLQRRVQPASARVGGVGGDRRGYGPAGDAARSPEGLRTQLLRNVAGCSEPEGEGWSQFKCAVIGRREPNFTSERPVFVCKVSLLLRTVFVCNAAPQKEACIGTFRKCTYICRKSPMAILLSKPGTSNRRACLTDLHACLTAEGPQLTSRQSGSGRHRTGRSR